MVIQLEDFVKELGNRHKQNNSTSKNIAFLKKTKLMYRSNIPFLHVINACLDYYNQSKYYQKH